MPDLTISPAPDEGTWDTTTDPHNPQPLYWPECATCGTAWVWRRVMRWAQEDGGTLSYMWLWNRDCKHKKDPILVTKDGPYDPDPFSEDDDGETTAADQTQG